METEHWILNHRVDSHLPGYLMLGAAAPTAQLSSLPERALREAGVLMAKAQAALEAFLAPRHVYVARYGHMAGHAVHFHIIPVCDWVVRLFDADARYRVLQNFQTNPGPGGTDGAELTLYIWREFCENPHPPAISGPSVQDVVNKLRLLSDKSSL